MSMVTPCMVTPYPAAAQPAHPHGLARRLPTPGGWLALKAASGDREAR
jgi:hypothetical protein